MGFFSVIALKERKRFRLKDPIVGLVSLRAGVLLVCDVNFQSKYHVQPERDFEQE